MHCSRCQGNDIRRTARRGFLDNLKASMGLYPFYCEGCGKRFYAARRYPEPKGRKEARRPAEQAHGSGAEMAFRVDETRPTAKVVIQADDHVQLDRILLALHTAVNSYQQQSTRETADKRR